MSYEQLTAALDELTIIDQLQTWCEDYLAHQQLEQLAAALSGDLN